MASNVTTMGFSVGSLVGLTIAGLLALLFLVSCILSVVKAVRDRRQIKARIQAKRAGLVHGNGHAPGASGQDKRIRPNILIIHDGEREQRIKKGSHLNSSDSSPRPPSGFSSPEEQHSRHTETTTLAEVACHHSSLNSSPGGDLGDGGAREDNVLATDAVMTNGHCLLPGAATGNKNELNVCNNRHARKSVDIVGETVMYRKPAASSPKHSDSGPVTTSLVTGQSRFSEHPRDTHQRGSVNGKPKSYIDTEDGQDVYTAGQRYAISEDNISGHSRRRAETTLHVSGSYHGFTKNKNAKVTSQHCVGAMQRKEYVCAKYNPRRNSYAAAIANPSWIDLPPVRRHSDEPRHLANSSNSRLYESKARMRHASGEGADNPAYEGTDDAKIV